MRVPVSIRGLSCRVLAIMSCAASWTIGARVAAGEVPELSAVQRDALHEAARLQTLEPWQREFLFALAPQSDGLASRRAAASLALNDAPASTTSPDGIWEGPPGEIGLHTAVFDPVRNRMLVFGGSRTHGSSNDVWALSLTGVPTWTLLSPEGAPPSGRFDHSAIYDPVRDRMLVFGGNASSNPQNDVWALSLSGATGWTQLFPAGTPPEAQGGHNAVYDSAGDRLLVIGGFPSFQAKVWALTLSGTPTWTQLTPTGTPSPLRQHASAIYDAARQRIVLFGGDPGTAFLNDVWVLTLAGTPAWSQSTPAGTKPTGRSHANAIYDPDRDRMVVYGGIASYSTSLNDAWELALAGQTAWTPLVPTGPLPRPREGHTAIYDQTHSRMVVFGGEPSPEGANEVSALSLAGTPSWSDLTPGGVPPSPRGYHSAVYDPARERMVVFGGWNGGAVFNDVWAMSLTEFPTWTLVSPTGDPPFERAGHSAVYDPLRDRMLVFGGFNISNRFGDLWELSLAGTPTWSLLAPLGTPPEARSGHSTVYDPLRDRMLVFGGQGPSSRLNDLWSLSLSGVPEWTLLTPADAPPQPRSFASAEYDPVQDRMLVYGGMGFDDSDLWALSLKGAPSWAPLAPEGVSPVARTTQSASRDTRRGRVVIFGGSGPPSGYLNDAWELSLRRAPAWSALDPDGTLPPERRGHSSIYDPRGDRLVMFGGTESFRYSNEAWFLRFTGTVAVEDHDSPPPHGLLRRPAPNPMRGSTTVQYSVKTASRVLLTIHDVNGRLVRRLVDGTRHLGPESITWDGRGDTGERAGAGVYFIRLAGPGTLLTQRVILLR